MANTAEHRATAGVVLATASLLLSKDEQQRVEQVLACGGLGYLFGTLPDILEINGAGDKCI